MDAGINDELVQPGSQNPASAEDSFAHAIAALHRRQMEGEAGDARGSSADGMRRAIESSEIGTFELDLSHGTTVFSPRTRAIFAAGMGGAEMPQTLEQFFQCVHRDDVASVREAARLHLQRDLPFEAEFRLQHSAGGCIWVHSRAYQLALADGSVHVWGFISDVTARKRWEQERANLDAQRGRARKTDVLGMLAGGVAHNFNNLLTPILGHAQHLLKTIQSLGSARASLEEIVSSVLRANDIINRLLLLPTRKPPQHQVPLQLVDVAREALDRLSSSLPVPVRVKLEVDDGCADVMGAHAELLQAIGNLCLNAAEVLRVSGTRLRVHVGMCEVDDEFARLHSIAKGAAVRLVVEDDGAGMPVEVLERAFDPFFTTKPVGQGLGLGLTMVDAIAKRHQGAVLLDSRQGRGTRCELYLPPRRPDGPNPRREISVADG